MFLVSREFAFCYGHRLLNHPGKCRHLHGHNGRVRIMIAESGLNQNGMVRDFTELKETIGQWIDAHLDHRTILAENDPLVPILQKQGEPLFLTQTNPTAESFAKLLFDLAEKEGFPVESVEFWETPKCRAVYRRD